MNNPARARRTFTLSLPPTDPNSAIILQWLDSQPIGMDVSPLMRQALATWLSCGPLLEQLVKGLGRVEAHLTQGTFVPSGADEEADEEQKAMLDQLLDFAHLD
jgi:hypothetical protein